MMSRLKELKDENCLLNKIYAAIQLQADVLKEDIAKKVVRASRRREMLRFTLGLVNY